jgi:hypothetical protein
MSSLIDKLNKGNKEKYQYLYSGQPRKSDGLKYLKECSFRKSFFKYYSNPVIKAGPHVTDPSKPSGPVKRTLDIPRAKSVKKEFLKCFPESMKGTMKGRSTKYGKLKK